MIRMSGAQEEEEWEYSGRRNASYIYCVSDTFCPIPITIISAEENEEAEYIIER